MKPGRKKAKKDEPSEERTPRTRAAVAREAAAKAAKEVEHAATKAAVAREAAAQAAKEAEAAAAVEKDVLEVPPLDTEYHTPPSPRTPAR